MFQGWTSLRQGLRFSVCRQRLDAGATPPTKKKNLDLAHDEGQAGSRDIYCLRSRPFRMPMTRGAVAVTGTVGWSCTRRASGTNQYGW